MDKCKAMRMDRKEGGICAYTRVYNYTHIVFHSTTMANMLIAE